MPTLCMTAVAVILFTLARDVKTCVPLWTTVLEQGSIQSIPSTPYRVDTAICVGCYATYYKVVTQVRAAEPRDWFFRCPVADGKNLSISGTITKLFPYQISAHWLTLSVNMH